MKRKIISILLILIMVLSFSTVLSGCNKPHEGIYEEHTVGNGADLTVGILSDSQLPARGDGKDNRWTENLEAGLRLMKDKNVEVLIFGGDFTDLSTKYAWQTFERIYDRVYPEDKPIQSFVLGNHDYWLDSFFKSWEIPTKNKFENRFEKYTGESSILSHKVVNGYHFIAFSSLDGSYDKSYNDQKWIKEQLDKAVADDPQKPIFVTTHLSPMDSVYGSEWGNADINSLLKDYPQVVSISGHSHYSMLDERAIHQGDFTSITTQALDYVELEAGKENGSIPRDEFGSTDVSGTNPMGMIMKIKGKNVTIERYDVKSQVKQKGDWSLDFPITTENQNYTTEKRTAKSQAPTFDNNVIVSVTQGVNIEKTATNFITFTQAKHEDFTHSYKMEFYHENGEKISLPKVDLKGNKTGDELRDSFLYFSDFYNGITSMKQEITLALPLNLPKGNLKVKIYAIESFGKMSEPIEKMIQII